MKDIFIFGCVYLFQDNNKYFSLQVYNKIQQIQLILVDQNKRAVQIDQMKDIENPPQNFVSYAPPQPIYNMFRGFKKKTSEMNKTILLKTKHLKDKQISSYRYDNDDEEIEQIDINTKLNQMEKTKDFKSQILPSSHKRTSSHNQMPKFDHISVQKLKRNLSSNNQNLMITTSRVQNNQQNNQIKKLQIPRFYSRNLHSKMNEYLNMVVAKSSHDHKQKLKQLKQIQKKDIKNDFSRQRNQKMCYRNKFLRELKSRSSSLSMHKQKSIEQMNKQKSQLSIFTANKIQNGEQLINTASHMLQKSMRKYFGRDRKIHRQVQNQHSRNDSIGIK